MGHPFAELVLTGCCTRPYLVEAFYESRAMLMQVQSGFLS